MNNFLNYLKINYYRSNQKIKIIIGKNYEISLLLFSKKNKFPINLKIIIRKFDLKILKKLKSIKKINRTNKSNITLIYKK